MGTAKRERQKAGRAQRLEEARLAEARTKRRNNIFLVGGIAVFVVVVLVLTNVFRSKDDTSTSASSTTGPTTSGTAAPTLPTVAPGATLTGATPCPAADGSSARTTTFAQAPPVCIDPAKTYTAKVSTSKGDFTIALDAKAAPKTVNNFVVLSRYHFYDGVPFHRVVPDFVIQTGDPLGKPPGSGGPGYQFDDELPKAVSDYKPGSVAMANSGPNTNGSQWFVWVGPQALPSPAYSLFGQVTDGLDTTVQAIIKGGSAGSDTPIDPTTIKYILIGEDGTYPQPPAGASQAQAVEPTVPASASVSSTNPPVSTPSSPTSTPNAVGPSSTPAPTASTTPPSSPAP
jgi:cyclophilin family peptidyl-prolyl cis-trans isomerase